MPAAARHAQAVAATGVAKFFVATVCDGISSASFRGHLVYVANQTQLPIPVAAVTAAWRSVAPIQTTLKNYCCSSLCSLVYMRAGPPKFYSTTLLLQIQ
jgi:hypothetical protein